jgi:hypothetical protein
MIKFLGLSSKEAVTQTAPLMDIHRNWRCELGTSWRDIEDAGSVVRAIPLRSSAVSSQRRSEDAGTRAQGESALKVTRWANFRILCSSIL